MKDSKHISKQMSYLLRHRPESAGLALTAGGWVEVDQLLTALGDAQSPVTLEKLIEVVATNDKQRFELSDDRLRIRARQGHSTEVDLGYEPAAPPDVLYHGTARHFVPSIREQGLLKRRRHHVHLSTNRETMLAVGQRHGAPVLIAVDAQRMHADRYTFYVTGNDVWLTEHVPPQYLREIE